MPSRWLAEIASEYSRSNNKLLSFCHDMSDLCAAVLSASNLWEGFVEGVEEELNVFTEEGQGDAAEEELRAEELSNACLSFVPKSLVESLERQFEDQTALVPDQSSPLIEPTANLMEACVVFSDASGFTALTERLASLPDGAEKMCIIMNDFLGKIISIVHAYKGDVVKFAGDAVQVIFVVTPELSLRDAVIAGVACCKELHRQLHMYDPGLDKLDDETEHVRLSLHIGVGCGSVTALQLGGRRGRWEYAIAGAAVTQSALAEPMALSGETCISPEAFQCIRDVAKGRTTQSTEGGYTIIDALSGTPRFSISHPAKQIVGSRMGHRWLLHSTHAFLPNVVKHRIAGGLFNNAELSEIRQVSVMFITCKGLSLGAAGDDTAKPLHAGQAVVSTVQRSFYEHEGSINKLLVRTVYNWAETGGVLEWGEVGLGEVGCVGSAGWDGG